MVRWGKRKNDLKCALNFSFNFSPTPSLSLSLGFFSCALWPVQVMHFMSGVWFKLLPAALWGACAQLNVNCRRCPREVVALISSFIFLSNCQVNYQLLCAPPDSEWVRKRERNRERLHHFETAKQMASEQLMKIHEIYCHFWVDTQVRGICWQSGYICGDKIYPVEGGLNRAKERNRQFKNCYLYL